MHDHIEPIDLAQRAEVLVRTEHFIRLASDVLEYPFSPVPVEFDLRGTTAGMFKVYGKKHWIRYNPWIFAKYYEENLRDTVPHEVAHYIIYHLYEDRRVKPHGPEWQALMTEFGADPGVTFNRDLSGVPQRRQRSHAYRLPVRIMRFPVPATTGYRGVRPATSAAVVIAT